MNEKYAFPELLSFQVAGTAKFICPQCGRSYFSSSQSSDGTITRHCKGLACNYSWPESDDLENFYVQAAALRDKELLCPRANDYHSTLKM